jgi:hypothetical protein
MMTPGQQRYYFDSQTTSASQVPPSALLLTVRRITTHMPTSFLDYTGVTSCLVVV